MEDLITRIKNQSARLEPGTTEDKDLTKKWGIYLTFSRNREATTKIIGVKGQLSIQTHRNRDEIWFALTPLAVYRGETAEPVQEYASQIQTICRLEETLLQPGDAIIIPKMTAHTARNRDEQHALILEISLGRADEDDIIRIYDMYGRVEAPGIPKGLTAPEVISFCRLNKAELIRKYGTKVIYDESGFSSGAGL